MVCGTMEVSHEELVSTKDIDQSQQVPVDELKQQLFELTETNKELHELVEALRRENAELSAKLHSSAASPAAVRAPGALPPPPPPPPPPPASLGPVNISKTVKERRSETKTAPVEKMSEGASQQSQLMSEVVEFLRNKTLGRSRMKRSMTQPDLSGDLEKFRRSRELEASDFRDEEPPRFRTDKADLLARELDDLKILLKNSSPPKSLAGPTKPATSAVNATTGAEDETEPESNSFRKRRASVSEIKAKLESVKTVAENKSTEMVSLKVSQNKDGRTSPRDASPAPLDSGPPLILSRTYDGIMTFDDETPDSELRLASRSSGIASSLRSESLSRLDQSASDVEDDNNLGSQTSPRIVITPVEDLQLNPLDLALHSSKNLDVRNQGKTACDELRHVISVSMPSARQMNSKLNGSGASSPQQQQKFAAHHTEDKRRFWENAAQKGNGSPNLRRSPTLERFQSAAMASVQAQKAKFAAAGQTTPDQSSPVSNRKTINVRKFR